jgi:hypothetical protein
MTQAMTVYRRSQLEDVDCLFRWNQVWNLGVDDSSDYSLRGQAFAAIKHAYLLRLVECHLGSDAEEAEAAFIDGIATHQTPTRLIPELRELWMRHAEVFTLDLDRYLASEDRSVTAGVSWSPDLVYAHPTELEVVDDKTFWTMWTEAEVRASFQARFYCYAARERWPGFASYRFTMNFVRFNKVTSIAFTHAELDHVAAEAQAARAVLEEAARTNHWPAMAGPSCRYCDLRCPIVDLPTRMPARLSAADAPAVASAILVGDKAVKGLKRALKGYCAANGPVPVGDVVFTNKPIEQRTYPVAPVVQALTRLGVMGGLEGEALTLSRSALANIFAQYPAVEEELAPFEQSKTIYRFGGYRSGADEGDD